MQTVLFFNLVFNFVFANLDFTFYLLPHTIKLSVDCIRKTCMLHPFTLVSLCQLIMGVHSFRCHNLHQPIISWLSHFTSVLSVLLPAVSSREMATPAQVIISVSGLAQQKFTAHHN